MAISTEQVQVATCDACGKRVFAFPDEDVMGMTGHLQISQEGFGYPLDFFSCQLSSEHIGQAVVQAMMRHALQDPQSLNAVLDSSESKNRQGEESRPQVSTVSTRVESTPSKLYGTGIIRPTEELRRELIDLWISLGRRPTTAEVRKELHLGSERVKKLMDSTPDPT